MSNHYETKEITEEIFTDEPDKIAISLNNLTYEELLDILSDPDYEMNSRVRVINVISEKFYGKCEHLVSKITSMYFFSGIQFLGDFIFEIVKKCKLDFLYKLELAKTLATNDERGFELIVDLAKNCPDILNRTEAIRYLYRNSKYRIIAYEYFLDIMNDPTFPCEDRYNNIFMIQTFPLKKDEKENCLIDTLFKWLDLYTIYTTYRILACQYLLLQAKIKDERRERIYTILFTVAEDRELDVNLRADAVDLVLQTRDQEYQVRALEILETLGNVHGRSFSIYENAQNVHNTHVEKSAMKVIEYLRDKGLPTKPFQNIYDEILKSVEEQTAEIKEKTKSSLLRIKLDVAKYYYDTFTLKEMLALVYAFAESDPNEKEIKKRIVEELCDSANVCSTGNAFRILNAITGFSEVGIQIGWEDQILSKFSLKFKNMFDKLSDEGEEGDFKFAVLEEWFIPTNRYLERQSFEKFFRQAYPSIREELWEEFKNDMEEPEFDLYTRKAVIKYLGY